MKMNRLLWITLLAAASLVPLTACKKNASAAKEESKITGSPSDPPVAIAPKWNAGQRYIMRMDSAQSYQLPNLGGGRGRGNQDTNNAPLESTFAQEYSLVVTNAADGQRGIEMEILAIELLAARGDQEFVNYASRNKIARQGGAVTEIFDQLIGGKIYYLVSAENKVVKVEGVKEFFDRLEPTPDAAGDARRGLAGGAGMLRNVYNEDMFRQLIEMAGAPPNSVRVGETWTSTRDAGAPMIGKLVVSTTNTLRGWQEHEAKKCARVDFSGTITLGTNVAANPMAAFMSLENGTVVGHYWFAPEIGIPIETVLEQNMTMSIVNMGGQFRRTNNTANANTNTPARISAPIHQSVSLKLLEIKPIEGH
jgi:hypothetical protein